jgi:hypothetical protein
MLENVVVSVKTNNFFIFYSRKLDLFTNDCLTSEWTVTICKLS